MAEKVMGIYYVRNTKTDQMYVGSSVDIDSRIKRHILALTKGQHHSVYLQRAWDKYGQASFDFGLAEEVEDRGQLQIREQEWIDYFGTYNVAKFADRPQPPAMTEERRRKLSEAMKGRPGTMAGKKHTDAARALMSSKRKGVKRPNVGAAISAGKKGGHLPDSAKEKLSALAFDRWGDPEKKKAFLDNFKSLMDAGRGPWVHLPNRKKRVRTVKHDAHVKLFARHNKKMANSPKYAKSYVLMTQWDMPFHDAHVKLWNRLKKALAASKSMRKNWDDPEFAERARALQVGKKRTEAQKAAISRANTGRKWTEERRERYNQTMQRPEIKAKVAAGRKSVPWTDEMRAKILASRAATNAIKKAMKSSKLEVDAVSV